MRRSTLTLIFALLAVSLSWSQSRRIGQAAGDRHFDPIRTGALDFRSVNDTLAPRAFEDTCSLTGTGYTITNEWGYVAGMNGYGDLEKAQLLELFDDDAAPSRLLEAWIFFDAAAVVGDGQWTVKVYSVNTATGGPGELLATSAPLRVSDIETDPQFIVPTIVPFASPVTVGEEFFVSVDMSALYDTRDTVSIFQTRVDCGNGEYSWELFGDGETWAAIDDSDISWDIEANFFIFAVVERDESTSLNPVSRGAITLRPAFPNPASAGMQINFELDRRSPVTVELFAADGRLLRRLDQGDLPAGPHTVTLPTGGLPAGAYLYAVSSGRSRLTSRFIVK